MCESPAYGRVMIFEAMFNLEGYTKHTCHPHSFESYARSLEVILRAAPHHIVLSNDYRRSLFLWVVRRSGGQEGKSKQRQVAEN
jgi:hypothetical protein